MFNILQSFLISFKVSEPIKNNLHSVFASQCEEIERNLNQSETAARRNKIEVSTRKIVLFTLAGSNQEGHLWLGMKVVRFVTKKDIFTNTRQLMKKCCWL